VATEGAKSVINDFGEDCGENCHLLQRGQTKARELKNPPFEPRLVHMLTTGNPLIDKLVTRKEMVWFCAAEHSSRKKKKALFKTEPGLPHKRGEKLDDRNI